MTMIDIAEFRFWHELRLFELDYPQPIVNELRRTREKWFQWQAKGKRRQRIAKDGET